MHMRLNFELFALKIDIGKRTDSIFVFVFIYVGYFVYFLLFYFSLSLLSIGGWDIAFVFTSEAFDASILLSSINLLTIESRRTHIHASMHAENRLYRAIHKHCYRHREPNDTVQTNSFSNNR